MHPATRSPDPTCAARLAGSQHAATTTARMTVRTAASVEGRAAQQAEHFGADHLREQGGAASANQHPRHGQQQTVAQNRLEKD